MIARGWHAAIALYHPEQPVLRHRVPRSSRHARTVTGPRGARCAAPPDQLRVWPDRIIWTACCTRRCRVSSRFASATQRAYSLRWVNALVTGLDARTLADLPAQSDQEFALHAGHARPPRVAVDGRHHREPLGVLTNLRDLVIVENHGGGGAAGLQMRREPDHSHAPILATGTTMAHRTVPAIRVRCCWQ